MSVQEIKKLLGGDVIGFIDVGVAGGPDPLFYSGEFRQLLSVVGFEPGPEEFGRLPKHEHVTYYPYAISNFSGETEFFVNSTVSSLKKNTVRETAFGETYENHRVTVERLQNLRETGQLPSVDILKVDVEGFDYSVLEGAGPVIDVETLCVKTEFSFHAAETGNIYEIQKLLLQNGFLTMNFQINQGRLGNLAGGDALFLKNPKHIVDGPLSADEKKIQLIKLIIISSHLGAIELAEYCLLMLERHDFISPAEIQQLTNILYRRIYVPQLYARSKTLISLRRKIGHLMLLFGLLVTGDQGEKSGIRSNRLMKYNRLFLRRRLIPDAWIQRRRNIVKSQVALFDEHQQ
jgi:FkbM family methyltransferase